MKYISATFYLSSLILLVACETQKQFSIEGHITGLPDSMQLELTDQLTGKIIDSTLVFNEQFNFNGHLDEEPMHLIIISGFKERLRGDLYYTYVLINNEAVHLAGDISDLPFNVRSSGSVLQKEAERFYKGYHQWLVKIDSAKNSTKALADSSAEKAKAEKNLDQVRSDLRKWELNYLKKNFNSHMALVTYSRRRDFPSYLLDSLYNTLSPELKETKYGKLVKTQIDFPKPKTGDSYYDFQSTNAQGKSVRLSETKDKYILLQFAGSGCVFSDQAIDHMKEIYSQYADSIEFFSTFPDSENQFKEYILKKEIPWSATCIPSGHFGEPMIKYAIAGTPEFYLISPEKKIVATWFGYEDGIIEEYIGSIVQN